MYTSIRGWLTLSARTNEFIAKLTDMSAAMPDKVNQTLIEVYMSINQSVLATIQRAEVMIDVAQEKNTTPFIDSALEQLKKATTELNNAMKRVADLLETMNNEKNGEMAPKSE